MEIGTQGRLYAKTDCGSVTGLPRNLRIWTWGGLCAQIDYGSVVELPRNLRIWTRGRLCAEDRLRIRCGAAYKSVDLDAGWTLCSARL